MSETQDRPDPHTDVVAEATPDVTAASRERLSSDSTRPIVSASLNLPEITTANTLPNLSLTQGPGSITFNSDSTTMQPRQPYSQNRFVNFTYGAYRGTVNTVVGTASTIFNPAQLADHTVKAVVTAGDAALNPVRTWNNVTTAAQNADAEQWGNFTGTAATALGFGLLGTRIPERGSLLFNNARTHITAESIANNVTKPIANTVDNVTSHAAFRPVARTWDNVAGFTSTNIVPPVRNAFETVSRPVVNTFDNVASYTSTHLVPPVRTAWNNAVSIADRNVNLQPVRNAWEYLNSPIQLPPVSGVARQDLSRMVQSGQRLETSVAPGTTGLILNPGVVRPNTIIRPSILDSGVSPLGGSILRAERGPLTTAFEARPLPFSLEARMSQFGERWTPNMPQSVVDLRAQVISDLRASNVRPLPARVIAAADDTRGLFRDLPTGPQLAARQFETTPHGLIIPRPVIPGLVHTADDLGGLTGRIPGLRPLNLADNVATNAATNVARTIHVPVGPIEATALSNARMPFALSHHIPRVGVELAPLKSAQVAVDIEARVSGLIKTGNLGFMARRDLQSFSDLATQAVSSPFKTRTIARMEELVPRIERSLPEATDYVRSLYTAHINEAVAPSRVQAQIANITRQDVNAFTARNAAEMRYYQALEQNTPRVNTLLGQASTQIGRDAALTGHVAEVQQVSQSITHGGSISDAIARLTEVNVHANNAKITQAIQLLTEQRTLAMPAALNTYDRIFSQLTDAATTFSRSTRSQTLARLEEDVMRFQRLWQNSDLATANPLGMAQHMADIQKRLLTHQRVYDPISYRGYAAVGGAAAFMAHESYLRYQETDPNEQSERRLRDGIQTQSPGQILVPGPDINPNRLRPNPINGSGGQETMVPIEIRQDIRRPQEGQPSQTGPGRARYGSDVENTFRIQKNSFNIPRFQNQPEMKYSADNFYIQAYRSSFDDENTGAFNMAWMQYAHVRPRAESSSLDSGARLSLSPDTNHFVHHASSRNTILERTASSQFNFSSPISSHVSRLDSRFTTASASEITTRNSNIQASSGTMFSNNLKTATPLRNTQGVSLVSMENVSPGAASFFSSPLTANLSGTVSGASRLPFAGTPSNQIAANMTTMPSNNDPVISMAALPPLSADPNFQASSSQNV